MKAEPRLACDRLLDSLQGIRDLRHVPDFAACLRHRDGDGFLVDINAHVFANLYMTCPLNCGSGPLV